MARRWIRALLAVSLFFSGGAPVALAQTAAWAKMALAFRRDGLSASMRKTFDGRHACGLCRRVGQASRSGPSWEAARLAGSLDLVFASRPPRLFSPAPAWPLSDPPFLRLDRPALPDSPPPEPPSV